MRAAFFALTALPLYAIAQHVPVNATTTATSETLHPVIHTSTEDFIGQLTTTDIALSPSTSDVVDDSETTTEQLIQDTTTIEPFQETTAQTIVHVDETTTNGLTPVIDTTQSANVIPQSDTTSQEDISRETTATAPATTTDQPPLPETTHEAIQDTTTGEPIVQDTTTVNLRTETTDQQPGASTTTVTSPDQTTDRVPAQDSTVATQPGDTETQPGGPKPESTIDDAKHTTKPGSDPVITQAPVPTIPLPEASSSVSSVSSQVAALMPIINQWKDNPEGLKEETYKSIEETRDNIIAVIAGLGGSPNVGCAGKKIKRRGFLGPIGDIINTLACMAEGLTKVAGGVMAGNVPAVTGAATGVQTQNDNLNDQKDDDKKSDEKESTKKEESTKQESSSEKTTEAASTSTEGSTTTTEASTTTDYPMPCASDTCGGACPLAAVPGKPAAPRESVDCKEIATFIIDGPLPSTLSNLDDLPAKKLEARSDKKDLSARTFPDLDDIPPRQYVSLLSPFWVHQNGRTS
ncbi:hypothetical protein IL306_011103, partial [Fusarium sp. DS 682]